MFTNSTFIPFCIYITQMFIFTLLVFLGMAIKASKSYVDMLIIR